MKKLTTFAMALTMGLMMLVSCNKDKENDGKAVFHATIESRTQGRTYLDPVDGQGQIKWKAGDKIRIYNGNGESAVFTLKSGANTTDGTFAYAGEFDMVPPFIAVYPSTATMNNDDMVVFELPAVQNLTETGTFANGANPMLAYGTDDNLRFQNLCGGLGIRLYGNNAHVSSITVMGVASEKLNGQFMVADEGLETSPYNDEGNNLVTLTCDVTLSATDTTDFYAVLPVGVLHNGVIVEIYDDGILLGQIPFPESNAAEVARNTIKSFRPVEIMPFILDVHTAAPTYVNNRWDNYIQAFGDLYCTKPEVIDQVGFCYSTTNEYPQFESDSYITVTGTPTGEYDFEGRIYDLPVNTKYYIRSYARYMTDRIRYGNVETITTY